MDDGWDRPIRKRIDWIKILGTEHIRYLLGQWTENIHEQSIY